MRAGTRPIFEQPSQSPMYSWSRFKTGYFGTIEVKQTHQSVIHEQGHAVSGFVALAEKVVRHPVAVGLQLVEGPLCVLVDQACSGPEPLDGLLEDAGHRQVPLLVVVDQRQQANVAISAPERKRL